MWNPKRHPGGTAFVYWSSGRPLAPVWSAIVAGYPGCEGKAPAPKLPSNRKKQQVSCEGKAPPPTRCKEPLGRGMWGWVPTGGYEETGQKQLGGWNCQRLGAEWNGAAGTPRSACREGPPRLSEGWRKAQRQGLLRGAMAEPGSVALLPDLVCNSKALGRKSLSHCSYYAMDVHDNA